MSEFSCSMCLGRACAWVWLFYISGYIYVYAMCLSRPVLCLSAGRFFVSWYRHVLCNDCFMSGSHVLCVGVGLRYLSG
jgi:hypothetical protein